MEKDCVCVKCEWKWRRRTSKPLQCPRCTARYWWDISRHGEVKIEPEVPTYIAPEENQLEENKTMEPKEKKQSIKMGDDQWSWD